MFEVGDAVVYPPHGGGYVKSIEEKEFLGKKEKYHEIEFLLSRELNVFVPSKLITGKNIRRAMTKEEMEETIANLDFCKTNSIRINTKPGQRKINASQLASINVEKTLNTLMALRKKRDEDKLNQAERKVFSKCRQMLVSELMASERIAEQEAEAMLKDLINDAALQA